MKILPIAMAAAGAALLLSTKKNDNSTTTNGGPITVDPTTSTDTQTTSDNTAIGRIDQRSSNYNLRAVHFKAFIQKQLDLGYDFEKALDIAWQLWSSPENKLSPLIPNKEAFYNRLYKDQPKRANIGSNLITWDSQPLYDNFDAYWSNSPTWSCAEWVLWHNKLEEHYNSTQTANQVWIQAWKSSEHDPDCWAFFCPDTSYCRYDCSGFVEYLQRKNIPVGNIISNVSCNLANVITNTTEGLDLASKILKYAIPAIALYVGYRYLQTRNLI